MEGYNCNIGAGILKLCMGENYTDATVVFREYVQNAIDAIYQAEKSGILDKNNNYVSIDIEGNDIIIQDRGTGVKSTDIGPVLIDLGKSTKDATDIGRYGIGRLSGANWCDEIIFETSYNGEPIKSILVFNSKHARQLTESNSMDCGSVMDDVTSLLQEPEIEEAHYFRVRLMNVKDELKDEKTIREYLSFIAPVPYEDTFFDDCQKKAFKANPEFQELSDNEKICKIFLNGKPVNKPYVSVIQSGKDIIKITPPAFYKITDEDFGDLAWGWYSLKENAQQMGNIPYKGIRLRQKNMAVGSMSYLVELFSNATALNYVIGEVFIMHSNIVPTGSRDGILSSSEYEELKIRLKKKFVEISRIYDALSRVGSEGFRPLIASQINIQTIKNELNACEDEATKKKIKEEIKEQENEKQKSEEALKNKLKYLSQFGNKIDMIMESTIKYWDKAAKNQVFGHNTKADSNNQVEQIEIQKIVKKLEEENSLEDEIKNDNSNNEQEVPTQDNSETKKPIRPKETDPFLILSSPEFKIIKKVFAVINAERRLDDAMKAKIKESLKKRILSE
ncbi:MAG: hypothetical protein MJ002_03955 [Paludibacteraceae bacterium]|nr:hypothetical protein [Paludibacteraceae bacterium]